ncbi:MAG: YhbY family RNA-binding protein [Burkholderiales bacterium]|nr:YhbY family RNA-binding protein [Burkholderiales bacterium]
MEPLTPAARRNLRALAHHLEPVVIVGQHGLTPPVVHEIEVALRAHELVKVRVLGDDRAAREAMLRTVATTLDCAPVQHVGKVLVLWRPNPDRKAAPPPVARQTPTKPHAKKKTPAPVDAVRVRRRANAPAWAPKGPDGGTGRRARAKPDAGPAGTAPATPRRRRAGRA